MMRISSTLRIRFTRRILLLLLSLLIVHTLIIFPFPFPFVEALIFTHKGWRIAMNIGRETETFGMASDWASSGCRLPLIVQCDFQNDNKHNNKKSGTVVPLTGDVRYTGPDGETIKPVLGGEWSMIAGNNNNNAKLEQQREISFTLTFPEELIRRDVILNAGSILRLDGLLYSTTQLKEMNDIFYKARNAKWDAGEQLNDIEKRRDASLKWNPNTNKWEQRYEKETLLSTLKKQKDMLFAERKIQKINLERPNPKDLSLDCGPFPGIDDGDVYFRKQGKVLLSNQQGDGGGIGQFWNSKKCVVGSWAAEPINDKPLSYY